MEKFNTLEIWFIMPISIPRYWLLPSDVLRIYVSGSIIATATNTGHFLKFSSFCGYKSSTVTVILLVKLNGVKVVTRKCFNSKQFFSNGINVYSDQKLASSRIKMCEFIKPFVHNNSNELSKVSVKFLEPFEKIMKNFWSKWYLWMRVSLIIFLKFKNENC